MKRISVGLIAAVLVMAAGARAQTALQQAKGAAEASRNAAVSRSGAEAKDQAAKAMGESSGSSSVVSGGLSLSPTLPPPSKAPVMKADEQPGPTPVPAARSESNGEGKQNFARVVIGITAAAMATSIFGLLVLSGLTGPLVAAGIGVAAVGILAAVLFA